jgi:hypothetical protein
LIALVSLPFALLCALMLTSRFEYPGQGAKVVLPGQSVTFEIAEEFDSAYEKASRELSPANGWGEGWATYASPEGLMDAALFRKGGWEVRVEPVRKYTAAEVTISRAWWPLW